MLPSLSSPSLPLLSCSWLFCLSGAGGWHLSFSLQSAGKPQSPDQPQLRVCPSPAWHRRLPRSWSWRCRRARKATGLRFLAEPKPLVAAFHLRWLRPNPRCAAGQGRPAEAKKGRGRSGQAGLRFPSGAILRLALRSTSRGVAQRDPGCSACCNSGVRSFALRTGPCPPPGKNCLPAVPGMSS